MIYKLKELNYQEKTKLTLDTAHLFFSATKLKSLNKVFNEITNLLGDNGRLKEEIWLLVTILCQCRKQDKTCSILPRDKNYYTYINKKTKTNVKLDRNRLCEIVDNLETMGYLDIYMGYKSYSERDRGYCTIIKFHSYLLDLIPDSIVEKQLKDLRYTLDTIEVCYKKGKDNIKYDKLTRFKGVTSKGKVVSKFNKFLSNFEICLDGKKYTLVFKRVYLEDLDGCGRWYECGMFQIAPSNLRETITIDGKPTTEVDVKCIHPAIIASYQGVNLGNKDPYWVTDDGLIKWLGEYCRGVCKLALMCIINTKTKRNAAMALHNIYLEEKDDEDSIMSKIQLDEDLCSQIIYSLLSHNKEIDFYDKKGLNFKVLQNIDSNFAEQVIVRCMSKGIPVLPYHDSFITTRDKQKELIEIMEDSWFYVVGSLVNYRIDIKF